MKFWDSPAIIPLLVPEAESPAMRRLYGTDPAIVAWWATEVECTSAIARRERTGDLPETIVAEARPSTVEFVSLDDRLLTAARREGFRTGASR